MIASLKAFHLDPLPSIRHAENKQLQLQVARELGLVQGYLNSRLVVEILTEQAQDLDEQGLVDEA